MLLGAILGGVVLGYLFRGGSEPQILEERREAPARSSKSLGDRVDRTSISSVLRGELNFDTQQRLQELEALAASDPAKALTKLPYFRDNDLLSLALTTLGRGWGGSDPEAAAKWLESLESEDHQISAALGMVPAWAEKNPENCLAWSTRLSQGNLREISLLELADTWVSNSPAEVFSRFREMPSEAGTERGLHVILDQWALDQPAAALDLLSGLGPEMRREEFLETALVSLTNKDPEMTWNEVGRIKDPERAEHIRGMALEALAETRPYDALEFAGSIGNPPAVLSSLARGWASWDRPAAEQWIATLEDPDLARSIREAITE